MGSFRQKRARVEASSHSSSSMQNIPLVIDYYCTFFFTIKEKRGERSWLGRVQEHISGASFFFSLRGGEASGRNFVANCGRERKESRQTERQEEEDGYTSKELKPVPRTTDWWWIRALMPWLPLSLLIPHFRPGFLLLSLVCSYCHCSSLLTLYLWRMRRRPHRWKGCLGKRKGKGPLNWVCFLPFSSFPLTLNCIHRDHPCQRHSSDRDVKTDTEKGKT